MSPLSDDKDVFFFYRTFEAVNDDLSDVSNFDYRGKETLNIAFLDLSPDPAELDKLATSRNLQMHCDRVQQVNPDQILGKFISYMNNKKFEKMKQLPNPTIITMEDK